MTTNERTYYDSKTHLYYDDEQLTTLANGIYSEDAIVYYYKDGKFHCEDGPAIMYPDDDHIWCFEGITFLDDRVSDFVHTKGIPTHVLNNLVKWKLKHL
jgi:hypothetical protein